MAQMWALLVCCLIIAFSVVLETSAQTSTTASTIDSNCIVNASLSVDEEGNLVECSGTEPRCCKVEGVTGCCPAETKTQRLWWIMTIIFSATACIMTVCFICFWCDSRTFPCIKPLEDKIPCMRKKTYGLNDEMSDLSRDIKKQRVNGSRAGGLNNHGFGADDGAGHRAGADEFAPADAYDTPAELRGQVVDDWWGGGGSTSGGAMRSSRDTSC